MHFPDFALSFRDFALYVLAVFLLLVAILRGPTEPPSIPQPASGYTCAAAIPHPHLPDDIVEDRPACDGWRPGLTSRGDPLTRSQRLEELERIQRGRAAFDAVMSQGIGE